MVAVHVVRLASKNRPVVVNSLPIDGETLGKMEDTIECEQCANVADRITASAATYPPPRNNGPRTGAAAVITSVSAIGIDRTTLGSPKDASTRWVKTEGSGASCSGDPDFVFDLVIVRLKLIEFERPVLDGRAVGKA
jgi:hypothetical protein